VLNAQEDVKKKLKECRGTCVAIKRTLRHKTKKDTQLKFYKTMALPCLMYGSELLILRRTDERQLKTAKLPFLLSVAGYTVWDKERSDGI
jgi:hypothetical protein